MHVRVRVCVGVCVRLCVLLPLSIYFEYVQNSMKSLSFLTISGRTGENTQSFIVFLVFLSSVSSLRTWKVLAHFSMLYSVFLRLTQNSTCPKSNCNVKVTPCYFSWSQLGLPHKLSKYGVVNRTLDVPCGHCFLLPSFL